MSASDSDVFESTKAIFRQEAEELLVELDIALLHLEASPTDGDAINRAFRAMHTLKGSGATAGFTEISAIVHDVEDIFNGARSGRVVISSPMIDLVLQMGDVVRHILFGAEETGAQLFEKGKRIAGALNALAAPAKPKTVSPEEDVPVLPQAIANVSGLWAIRFAPDERIHHRGHDPFRLVQELLTLGHGTVRADSDRLLSLAAIDPTLCYLSWDIQLATSETEQAIKDIFLFVGGQANLRVEPLAPSEAWVLPIAAYLPPSIVQDFREEAAEDIAEIEGHVLALEGLHDDPGHLAGLKRSLHNLKGLCGLVLSEVLRAPPSHHPLRGMSELCHAAETFLDARGLEARVAAGERASEGLLETVDWLKELLHACDEAREAWPGQLMEWLDPTRGTDDQRAVPIAAGRADERPMSRVIVAQCDEVIRSVQTRQRPGADVSLTDWVALARVLNTLKMATAFEGAPKTSSSIQVLASICEDRSQGPAVPGAWADFHSRYRDILTSLDAASETPSTSVVPEPLLISIRPSGATKVSLRPSKAPVTVSRSPGAAPPPAAAQRSVRVDQTKLDALAGAIGELLVARNALPVLLKRPHDAEGQAIKDVNAMVDRIAHIADDLQNAMRQIQMMPIRSTFQRFPRMIRDLARSENKQVQFVTSGDDVELSKTVLEQIGDPLMHLVRNALDHGIELPAARVSAGKAETGTIALDVLKDGTNVIIRISDDGRGMVPARLRAKAVEKKLLSESEASAMSDQRALELIFLPGFSTAEIVTDISGRGVGMDVVQSNIRQLHGAITIASEVGRGSVVSIKLPSSLMVSKGMLVECDAEQFVLPIEGVREMVKIRADRIHRFRGVAMTSIRGAICPIYSLSQLFGFDRGQAGEALSLSTDEANAAIISTQGGAIAVVVDRLVAEIDVIIKPLSRGLDKLSLFQGATILGDGRVALIVDLERLGTLAGVETRLEDPSIAAVA